MTNLDADAIAARWADELPRDFARELAAALRMGFGALEVLKNASVLASSADAVKKAIALTKQGDGAYTGGVLAGRLATNEAHASITAVWTGPESRMKHTRLTLAVVADLIDEARTEIVLASYAAFPGVSLKKALHSAVEDRGVSITLLLERPIDNPHFDGSNDPFPGLAARRLSWPQAARPGGKTSMHAKVLVIDRIAALVGSANLTGPALERNLECGVLIRGGGIPGELAMHLLTAPGLADC